MGIQYDPTKPAANDKPTNDQPVMQTNFASIKRLIDIDHTDFSDAAFGTHLKVTFGSNNPPTPPVSPPVLFTNITSVSALPQIFYYSGDSTKTSDQYYINQTTGSAPNSFFNQGSTYLFGGMILKWGIYDSVPGDVPRSLSFFKPFPTNTTDQIITFGSNVTGNAGDLPIAQSSINSAGFVIQRVNSSGAGTFRYYIQVIGH